MQMKKMMKEEKGSMAVYVTIVLLTFLVVISILHAYTSSLRKSQLKTIVKIKEAYEDGIGEAFTETTVSGIAPLTLNNTVGTSLTNYKIYGNSVQDGSPTTELPVEVQSVGDNINLFNIDYALNLENYTKAGSYQYIPIQLEIGKTYTLYSETLVTGKSDINLRLGRLNDTTFTAIKTIVNSSEAEGTKIITFEAQGNEVLYSYSSGWIQQSELENLYNEYTKDIIIAEGSYETKPYEYKISINISGDSYIIYLDEPLRKIGDYADYIDFENKKIVRNVEVIDNTGTLSIEESLKALSIPISTSIELPAIYTLEGASTIEVDTTVQPSKIVVEYKKLQ